MKPIALYNVEVELENSDLVALVRDRIFIRDGDRMYLATQKCNDGKIPRNLEVNSIGSLAAQSELETYFEMESPKSPEEDVPLKDFVWKPYSEYLKTG